MTDMKEQGGGEVVAFDIERARTLIDYVVGYARAAELKPMSSDACVALRKLHAILHAAPPSAPVGVEVLRDLRDRVLPAALRHHAIGPGYIEEAQEIVSRALAQQPATVDEAMVERACAEFFRGQWPIKNSRNATIARNMVRDCLTAALAAQPGGVEAPPC